MPGTIFSQYASRDEMYEHMGVKVRGIKQALDARDLTFLIINLEDALTEARSLQGHLGQSELPHSNSGVSQSNSR